MTQNQIILKHLKQGRSISAFEAIMDYNIFRLGARIWELKKAGHRIESELKTNPATGKHYARYSLVSEWAGAV